MSGVKFTIKNNQNETLVGVQILPNVIKDKYPCVIMVHGFAYFKEEDGLFVEVGRRLAEIGVASYRFDFSGCGESEGDYSKTTLSKLRDDLESILDYVKKMPTTDADKIGIFAQSFGTTVTVSLSPKVKTVILMGAFINAEEVFKSYFGKDYKPKGISSKLHSDGRITKIEPGFWSDFKNHNMLSLLKAINSSLLLIYGSNDDTVPLSSVDMIYKNANHPKEQIIIKGADHGLEPKREEMYKDVIEWFRRTL